MHPSGLIGMGMEGDFCYMSVRTYRQKFYTVIFLLLKVFYAEIILHKKRWLINCSYNTHKNNICRHLEVVTKTLDSYYSKYENVIFLGDFNAGVLETPMTSFCESYDLKIIIKQPTCFKNSEKPSYIDLIQKNRPKSFQSTCVTEAELSDFHRMTVLY